MNSTVKRLVIVVGLVLVVHGSFYIVRASIDPPTIEWPSWSLAELPLQMDGWKGRDQDLDPEMFEASEAKFVVNRRYSNELGREMSVHIALFDDPSKGVYHNPGNCYLQSNWRPVSQEFVPLKSATRPEIRVRVQKWEQNAEKALVLYWYEVGDYTLFERTDLLKVRWGMRGQKTWPPTVKVMLHVPLVGLENTTQDDAMEIAKFVRDWIGKMNQSTPAVE